MARRGTELVARLGLVALGLVPAAVLGVAFWPTLSDHPTLSSAAFTGYAALVAACGFLGMVVTDLQGRWVKRTADSVDRWVLWRISRFEQEYRELVRSSNRFIDLKGLATRGDYTPGVEKVFVDVSLTPRPPHQATQDALADSGSFTIRTDDAGPGPADPPPAPVRRTIGDFLGQEEGTTLAVLGAPGTGKTTLLKHLALRLSRPGRGRGFGGRDLPVLLFLHDHAATVAADPEITLPEVIRASLGGLREREPAGWFDQRLREGACLVLLDGLDEVARDSDRRAVSAWVERQIASYEKNDFVLTSRPHGYRSAPLNRALALQVRRFTGEQIAQFVHGWYRAIEQLSTGMDDPGVTARAATEAEDLLARLRGRPTLYDLAANPLLLTMIANVHRYRSRLPGSRADLYHEICEVLLTRRDADEQAGPRKREVVLRELAYAMMVDRQRDIQAERAAELLAPTLSRVAVTQPPDALLASALASGLLVEREAGLFSFAHLTLQEHLAARHIQHHGLGDVLAASVDDDWWRETTLLYAAGADPAHIVEACLASNTTTALALAFDCAEIATEFSPETAGRLEALRRRALTESGNSARRRLMTAVTVTRRLRETIRLSDDVQISARPVSTEIYRLFCADTGTPAGPEVAEAADDAPAAGVPRRHAPVFVRWVNEILPDDAGGYRLPDAAEVADPAFRLTSHSAEHTIWYAAPAGPREPAPLPLLWVPDGTAHPWSAALPAAEDWPDPDSEEVLWVGSLGISRSRALAIAGYLDDALALAHELESTQSLTRVMDHARAAARDLADDLDVAIAGGLDLGADSGDALALARGLARDLAEDLARARLQDLVYDLDQDVARVRARELAHDLARIRDAARALACQPDFVRVADRTHDALLIYEVLQHLAGQQPRRRWGGVGWSAKRAVQVIRGYLDRHPTTRAVLPGELDPALRAATERTVGHPAAATEDPPLRQLAETTAELFASADAAAGAPGTAVRARPVYLQLAPLALAVAADELLADPETAALYRTVAVGAAARSHRAAGALAPSETIVLARTT